MEVGAENIDCERKSSYEKGAGCANPALWGSPPEYTISSVPPL